MQRRTIVWLTVVTAVVAAVTVASLTLRSPSTHFPIAKGTAGPTVNRAADSKLVTTQSGILFEVASATLDASALPALNEMADKIKQSHLTGAIKVEGYTDDAGEEDYNFDLSQRRADAVATWLTEKAGIEEGRITLVPYGESQPVVPNDSDAHRRANRRVVIEIDK